MDAEEQSPAAPAPLNEIHWKFRKRARAAREERDAPGAADDACINPPHIDVTDVMSPERVKMAQQETLEGRAEAADPNNPRTDSRSCAAVAEPREMSPVPLLPLAVSQEELMKLTLQSFPGRDLNWAETGRLECANVLASTLCRSLVSASLVETALGTCDRFYALLKYPSHPPRPSRAAAAAVAGDGGGEPAAAPRRRPGRQRPHHRAFGETALFQRERTFMNNGLLAGVCMVKTGVDPAPAPPAPPAPAAAEPESRSSRSSSKGLLRLREGTLSRFQSVPGGGAALCSTGAALSSTGAV